MIEIIRKSWSTWFSNLIYFRDPHSYIITFPEKPPGTFRAFIFLVLVNITTPTITALALLKGKLK